MLTIQNVERIRYKVIGNTVYYVSDIKPVALMDTEKPYKTTHCYLIELTNRHQFIMLQLDREGFLADNRLRLYEMKLGRNKINLNKFQLRNMDLVINNIKELLLEQWLP